MAVSKLSPMMRTVLEQFPIFAWRWVGGARHGFWIESQMVIEQAGRYAGYATLKALERRGLLRFQVMAPYKWNDDKTPLADWQKAEHFISLTAEGVLVRAELAGEEWR